jgi:hypothetical protein
MLVKHGVWVHAAFIPGSTPVATSTCFIEHRGKIPGNRGTVAGGEDTEGDEDRERASEAEVHQVSGFS